MNRETRAKFIFIVVLTASLLYAIAPIPNKPRIPILSDAKMNQGIDLQGGAELRYRVLYPDSFKEDRAESTKAAADVIRKRVEAKQLKEPKINAQGADQIIIQLAGVDRSGLEDYKRLIQQAGKLEFFAVANKEIQERYNKDKTYPVGYTVIPNTERDRRDPEYEAWGGDLVVREKPIITGQDIDRAEKDQIMRPGGVQYVTQFWLKSSTNADKLFDEAAKILYHQRPAGMIAIVLDEVLRSAPVVQAESFEGQGHITGAKNEQEALELAIILKSGSLPAPIGRTGQQPGEKPLPESETFVGPTLGEDAINRGKWASGLTLALVSLFMIVYYRKAGFIAVVSLILNLVFLLGIMALFKATITLPGIAGIVLTVGMAVDANILILERIREEQARGKSATQAFEAGHERALSAILDGNLTTVVAAIVLFYFGTGPVQGFAVTLVIGIATTLFSVLFCAKTFLKMLLAGGLQEFRMLKLMSDPKLDYLKVARTCVLVSTVMVVGGTLFTALRGTKNLGIDFNGGSMLAFAMTKEQSINDVRKTLQTVKGADGLPKYPDVEVQTVAEPGAEKFTGGMGGISRTFQLRTSFPDINVLKDDVQREFKATLSHEPFEEMKPEEVDKNPRILDGRPAGVGWHFYVDKKHSVEEVRKKIATLDMFQKNDRKEPLFLLVEVPDAHPDLRKLTISPTKADSEREGFRTRLRERMKDVLKAELARDPFIAQGSIGPAVAKELVDSSFWAMVISWALMIVYIAIRFASWRYGVAAVAALVHDALIAIAFTSLAGAVIPKSWGLSFEMNLTTMAAILTIIGFSINDTIVIFDRVRENLILMKKAPFREIINTSVNQTMSRTILTAFTVWISCVILYAFTMNTGGGIAEFAFPLLIGVIAGTYSTIYIASPIVLWWYGGQRPQTP